MKQIFALALLSAVAIAISISDKPVKEDDEFAAFVAKYNKSYESVGEYNKRKVIFENTKKNVDTLNGNDRKKTFAINSISDLDDDEYKAKLGFIAPPRARVQLTYDINPKVLTAGEDMTVDWSTFYGSGNVSPVKD
jgi:hypothetical protein